MNLYSIISKFPSSYLFSLVFCSDFLHYQWEKNKLRSEFVPVLKKRMILAKGMCFLLQIKYYVLKEILLYSLRFVVRINKRYHSIHSRLSD